MRIGALVSSQPYIHNSQHWCLQTDAAVLAAVVLQLAERWRDGARGFSSRRGFSRPFEASEAASIVDRARATMRGQLFYFYACAAWFKVRFFFFFFDCHSVAGTHDPAQTPCSDLT